MAFKHGVDYIETKVGPLVIRELATGIVALVGIAPIGPVDQLVLVRNQADAAQFGLEVPGTTIPGALRSIFEEGGSWVLTVNVFKQATHVLAVVAEVVTMTNGRGKLIYPPVGTPAVIKNAAGAITYVKDTDYTIDGFGVINVIPSGAIVAGTNLQASYSKINPSAVTAADIIGAISAAGVKTGSEQFALSMPLNGFEPKIFIAPGFSELSLVANKLRFWAQKMQGVALIDAPAGTTVANAVAGRSVSSVVNFNISDNRAIICFPRLKSPDPYTGGDTAKPYSQFYAGLIGKVDREEGYHINPSNHVFQSASYPEIDVTGSILGTDNDAYLLGQVGINTVMVEGVGGMSTWGTNNSSFPAESDPLIFINVRRVVDIALRSIMYASRPWIGKRNITIATIDNILETANAFIRDLIDRGALMPGSEAIFDISKNSANNLNQGIVKFTLRWLPPLPMQAITYESLVDVTLNTPITI